MWRFAIVMILLVSAAGAQGVLEDAAARKNLVKSPAAMAPAGVKAGGDVELQVEIDFHGRVTAARVISGPEKLRVPALDAVQRWEFKPFGAKGQAKSVKARLVVPVRVVGAAKATPAQAKTAVPVEQAEEAAPQPVAPAAPVESAEDVLARRYFTLADECHRLVAAKENVAEEVKACRDAADVADKFGPETRFIERRSAYVFAATALMRTDDLKSAAAYGNKAIAVVKQGHDDASGAGAAYTVRAQAEGYGGDLAGADRDLTIAEGYERDGLAKATGTELEKTYRFGLKSVLTFHAQVLGAMGKKAEADGKTSEAAKL